MLNSLKEIGYGLLFGCFPNIMLMDNGLLQEKSISWNLEEMILHILKEDMTVLVLLYIGDHTML